MSYITAEFGKPVLPPKYERKIIADVFSPDAVVSARIEEAFGKRWAAMAWSEKHRGLTRLVEKPADNPKDRPGWRPQSSEKSVSLKCVEVVRAELSVSPTTVARIVSVTDYAKTTVQRALYVLEGEGIARCEKVGYVNHWRLA